MTVLALTKDNRVIAATAIPTTYVTANTPVAVSATVSDLRKVEDLLSVKLYSVGNVLMTVSGISISGNAVGVTVVPSSTGGTVTGEIVTVGF